MKETLTGKQITMLIAMFCIGTSVLSVSGISAGRDIWLATIIAIAAGLPMAAIYARLMTILPGKDFFYVLEFFLGKVFSRIVLALFLFSLFDILILINTHFGMFVTGISLTDTPIYVIYFSMILICAMAVKSGIEILGRWNQIALIAILSFLFITLLFSIQKLDFMNLRPVLYEGISPVLKGSANILVLPICETYMFMFVLPVFKKGVSSYKAIMGGVVFGSIVILLIALMDVLVIGADYGKKFPYLTYKVLSLIKIGEFMTRLEIIGAIMFIFAVFIKASIAMLGLCKGLAKILGFNDYRNLVMPVALLTGVNAVLSLTNVIEFINRLPVFIITGLPFEVVLPFILFVFIEIKYRVLKKKNMLPMQQKGE